jgi:hypothetical protein
LHLAIEELQNTIVKNYAHNYTGHTECIDYILKTEFILPPHVAAEVRTASFVNVHGGLVKIRQQTCIRKMR